jgi:hypothetical protein
LTNEYRTMTLRLLRVYRQASPEQLEVGRRWYPNGLGACEKLAAKHETSTEHVVVALAHLSPRMHWTANLDQVDRLLSDEAPAGVLTRSWTLAQSSLLAEYPLTTFGRQAFKTRPFALAILGDLDAIPLDTWAWRAAGAIERPSRSKVHYNAAVDAYRRAARQVHEAPRDLQAICWLVVRGSAT